MNKGEALSEAAQNMVRITVNSREWTSEPAPAKVRIVVNRRISDLW
jgi:hypothetical protein